MSWMFAEDFVQLTISSTIFVQLTRNIILDQNAQTVNFAEIKFILI